MSDHHLSDPGFNNYQERNFDPGQPCPHSPFTGEVGMRAGQRVYGRGSSSPGPSDEGRLTGGPPMIPLSGELFLRNYGHIPGNQPPGLPPAWTPVAHPDDRIQSPPPLPPLQPGVWVAGGGRGTDSPLPSGYDYQFVPPLEPKYECPVCLMCLRDTVQTECGHRFCGECIKQCLRATGLRCPVDNVPLTESQMFPDVCVRREILDLQAHCPFTGCPEVIELRTMDNHKDGCSFRTEPCPNHCGASMRRKSIDHHLDEECPKRLVECPFCKLQLPFNQRQTHLDACPHRSVCCQFCHQAVISQDLSAHHQRMCPAYPVPCQFSPFGCTAQLPKEQMVNHMTDAMATHLQLLGVHLTRQIHSPESSLDINHQEHGWQNGGGFGAPPSKKSEYATAACKTLDAADTGMKKPDMEMLGRTQMGKACTSIGAGPSTLASCSSMGATPLSDPWDPQVKSLKDGVKNLQEKEVLMRQRILELEAKNKSKDSEIRGLRDRVEFLQKEVKDLREHVANGVFVWRLHRYTELRQAADRGEPTVRHSDGFYTSSCGYRLCIRVNINKSEVRGAMFISLFVHFMQGKYDDFLDWPFKGSIKLSIMDQSDDLDGERKNINEVLMAKSSLDAFKRPRTVRNHKGFGYMEFASVEALERDGRFIKDEMVLIKVEVHPQ